MQIAGEEKIDVAACESGHGHVGAADQATEAFRRWSVERMMSDDNVRDVAGIGLQPRAGCRHLAAIDASVLEGERSSGVDAQYGDLAVGEAGLQVMADVAPIIGKRSQLSGNDVIERHIMIAGHDDFREGQRIEEIAGLAKLMAPCPLREIPGNNDDIGLGGKDAQDQRGQDIGVQSPEMQIGKMDDGAQRRLRRSGVRLDAVRRGHDDLERARKNAIFERRHHGGHFAIGRHAGSLFSGFDDHFPGAQHMQIAVLQPAEERAQGQAQQVGPAAAAGQADP